MKTKQETKNKKKLMVETLIKKMGSITAACKICNLNRSTHYDWLATDPEYKKAVEELPLRILEFVENALYKKIQEGDTSAITFWLKHKNMARKLGGYSDMRYIQSDVRLKTDSAETMSEVYELVNTPEPKLKGKIKNGKKQE